MLPKVHTPGKKIHMESSKKIVVLLILVLLVGAGAGYYLGNKKPVTVLEKSGERITVGDAMTAEKKALVGLKLDLLKNYTNFVFLPPEATGNSSGYMEKMEKIKQFAEKSKINKIENWSF